MGTKITPATITGGYLSVVAANANFQALADEFDKCLYRTGLSPNFMTAHIDMNGGNRVINMADGASGTDAVNLRQLQAAQIGGPVSFPSQVGQDGKVLQTTAGAVGWISAAERLSLDLGTALEPTLLQAKNIKHMFRLDRKAADVASAATLDLDAVNGDYADLTGVTGVTAITLAEGVEKTLRTVGIVTFTHGASLVLPGAVNLVSNAGMYLRFRGRAGGVVHLSGFLNGVSSDFSFLFTTKGDILTATAVSTPVRKGVGTDGQVLSANSAVADGLEYVALGAGATRQSVLSSAVDANGYAAGLTTGAGLRPGLDASPTAMVLAYASGFGAMGALDVVSVLSADASDPIGADLSPSNTSYIFNDYLTKTTVTWNKTLVPPQDGYAFDRTQNSLLHFDGTDASTTMLDDFGNTWAASGNAQLDTAQQKFGSASLLLDGTGDFIESTNFTTLSGDSWEMSCWFRANATSAVHTIFAAQNATGFGAVVSLDHNAGARRLRVELSSNGTADDIGELNGTTTTIALATWHKARLVFDALAGSYKLYLSVNGAAETTEVTQASTARIAAITRVTLGDGSQAADVEFNGWLDEFRLIRCATATALETPKASAYAVNEANQLVNFFSIPKMQTFEVVAPSGAAGVDPTLTARNRVFVGEADTSGAAVTAVRNYALRGVYLSAETAIPAASTTTSFNDNIGTRLKIAGGHLINQTPQHGWVTGDKEGLIMQTEASSLPMPAIFNTGRNTSITVTGSIGGGFGGTVRSNGAYGQITPANWKQQVEVKRGW